MEKAVPKETPPSSEKKPLRIAVNTRLLLKGKLEGIGWFTFETLKRITQAHPEHEFIFIFDRKYDPSFVFSDNVKAVVAHPQARHPILWYLFFEIGVYRVLKKHKPDIFVSPDGWLSLRSSFKSLAVIHDLNFEAHPEFLPKHIVKFLRSFFPRFARKATRIATVSEYSRKDLNERYGIDLSKIDVVYNGANVLFKPLAPNKIQEARDRVSGGAPFFLFVGLIHPRKNLENQLRAFDAFKTQTGSNHKFVIVGVKYWWNEGLTDILENTKYKDDIIFLGRQGMDTLVDLYGSAFAVMYVSYYEGFGIPIVEAFYAEVPVITSVTSSMPEICGGAGLTVNPDSISEITNAMISLAEGEKLRLELIEKGRVQREKFSWDKTATALWNSILKAVNEQK